ncbi:MerR family transcriptional regulator [Streptomyces sp. NPDC015032]|uniref:helix-turn-helix domain-containing protein n=1 Tax=Streptomyces sp. NPDC015032 TaxID=3364937 RepID=UPI0036FA7C60
MPAEVTVKDLYSISEVAEAFGLTVPALRFYEERGLLRHSERRGRVRYYSREDLARLAYAQLWHDDGMLTLAETSAIVGSEKVEDRLGLITAQRDAMLQRIEKLNHAVAVLSHMLGCRTDDALACPMTGEYIRGRVDAALNSTPHVTDFFLPDEPGEPGELGEPDEPHESPESSESHEPHESHDSYEPHESYEPHKPHKPHEMDQPDECRGARPEGSAEPS